MNKLVWGVSVVVLLVLVMMWPSGAEADEMWPPRPGIAAKFGGGLYHSVPCRCLDRQLTNVEFAGRLHFGRLWGLEADIQRGLVVVGGNFPSSAWSVGGRLTVLPDLARWWDELSVRLGYKRWSVMGMRAGGANGVYTALSWTPEVLPHIHLETDVVASRVFRDMPHWSLGGRLGLAVRF